MQTRGNSSAFIKSNVYSGSKSVQDKKKKPAPAKKKPAAKAKKPGLLQRLISATKAAKRKQKGVVKSKGAHTKPATKSKNKKAAPSKKK